MMNFGIPNFFFWHCPRKGEQRADWFLFGGHYNTYKNRIDDKLKYLL